jgi:hypothetical protein
MITSSQRPHSKQEAEPKDGQAPSGAPPPQRQELLLPVGKIEYRDTARTVFPVLPKRHRYFVYGQLICELNSVWLKDKQFHNALQLLEPDALRSRLEGDFRCMAWREKRQQIVKVPARCPHDTARVLLKSDEAFELLPPLRVFSACPVLYGEPKMARILGQGYHQVAGGIYVQGGDVKLSDTIAQARKLLLGLLDDFSFVTEADKSRAAAFLISPALRSGQLLGEGTDFPLDLSEANRSQAGKTLRLQIVQAIYDEQPYIIINRTGGVGSIDESVSSALVTAKAFIIVDNFRGTINSQILESCLRGLGHVGARIPHHGEQQVPTGHVNWQLSSNGLDGPLDFANRTIISRIQKHDQDYEFHDWPEGSLLAHIKANQPTYLGAVFELLLEWDKAGRPTTKENQHDFREWCQALDWIVQNYLLLPRLLEGHTEELLRISSPALSWLRQVALAIERLKRLDEELLPNEIAQICNDAGIPLSKSDRVLQPELQTMLAGRYLNHIFNDGKTEASIDRFIAKRRTESFYDDNRREIITKHYHSFGLRSP